MVREDAIRVQSTPIQKLGEFFIRYGLVIVLGLDRRDEIHRL